MTSDVNVAASQIRAVFQRMIWDYEESMGKARDEMIRNLRRDASKPNLPDPTPGYEWVATYVVEQSVLGPESGPFEQKIEARTSWAERPIVNAT